MKRIGLGFLMLAALTGCKTTEEPPQPVSWGQQSAYLARVRDPRLYGLGIYQTSSGIEFRGGGRLHPGQMERLDMEAKKPFRPVVMLRGNFGRRWPVLLDLTANKSWVNFDLARKLEAVPVGEREAMLLRESDSGISRAVSLIPSMRLGQLFIEQSLVQVRLTEGSAGSLERGIEKPQIKGVLGWDILRRFAQIQFRFDRGEVILVSDEVYRPNPDTVIARLPLVTKAGACAVRGTVDGKERLILIDPSGDFDAALPGATPGASITLTDDLIFSPSVLADSPGGLRLGAGALQPFRLTVCPQAGVVYFEKTADE
jgi:hypothetical protein